MSWHKKITDKALDHWIELVLGGTYLALTNFLEPWQFWVVGILVVVVFIGLNIRSKSQVKIELDSVRIFSSRISLLKLAREAEKRGWELLNPKSLHILDFFDAVRQAGVDGKVEISGRPTQTFVNMTKSQPLVPIASDKWITHEIDVFTFFKWKNGEQSDYADDNFETNVKCLPESGAEPRYFDIHLERAAALEWLDTEAIHFRGRRED